jgi:hypothetical protein
MAYADRAQRRLAELPADAAPALPSAPDPVTAAQRL